MCHLCDVSECQCAVSVAAGGFCGGYPTCTECYDTCTAAARFGMGDPSPVGAPRVADFVLPSPPSPGGQAMRTPGEELGKCDSRRHVGPLNAVCSECVAESRPVASAPSSSSSSSSSIRPPLPRFSHPIAAARPRSGMEPPRPPSPGLPCLMGSCRECGTPCGGGMPTRATAAHDCVCASCGHPIR